MKIGVIDSGVGGFSVLRELYQLMPCEEYFYLSDQEHSPYGDKDTEYLRQRLFILTDELLTQNVDLIVIACHTATAQAIEALRSNYSLPFVGIEPYLNVLRHPQDGEQYVVLMTESTSKSKRFHELRERLDPNKKINLFACKKLASIIEAYFHDEITAMHFENSVALELEQVAKLKSSLPQLTTAILGCTHYPLVSKQIESVTGLETIFPGLAIAKRVQERLQSLFAYSTPISPSTDGFHYRRKVSDPWQHKPWKYLQKVTVIS
tara:strand:+ start:13568 stop:14359 length:792 start_codon:yes stop_codon:yes gene_type:complete